MKRLVTLTASALALALLASCVSTKSNKIVSAPLPPIVQAPDSSLLKKCLRPINLGDKALTQEEIENLWSTDRYRLIDCAKRQRALIDFINERDSLIQGVSVK